MEKFGTSSPLETDVRAYYKSYTLVDLRWLDFRGLREEVGDIFDTVAEIKGAAAGDIKSWFGDGYPAASIFASNAIKKGWQLANFPSKFPEDGFRPVFDDGLEQAGWRDVLGPSEAAVRIIGFPDPPLEHAGFMLV